jgi:phosphoribosyl 1,2-cyclic phosphodiesterase
VRAGGQILILDAGTGLRLLGQALLAEFGEKPLELTLLLTHTHWDHIQGLPFFSPAYLPGNRLRILGQEGARLGLESILNHQMESHFFPVGLPGNIVVEEFDTLDCYLGPVRAQACRAQHPGVCVGYRLTVGGRSLAFFPDNELSCSVAEADSVAAVAPDQTAKLCDFLRDTDVLIMDTQYDCTEYQQHVGWGHGCVDEVVALALAAGVKQLFLFHHDPDHDDARISAMTAHARELVAARNGRLVVEAAQEGRVVEV